MIFLFRKFSLLDFEFLGWFWEGWEGFLGREGFMEIIENDVLLYREEIEVYREVVLGFVWVLCWW